MARSLDDVCLKLAEYWPPIDPEIVDLVKALNIYGNWVYSTGLSCAGHLDKDSVEEFKRYYPNKTLRVRPNISFELSKEFDRQWGTKFKLINKRQHEFVDLIRRYNSQTQIKWEFEYWMDLPGNANGTCLRTVECAETQEQLSSLHQSSKDLARFMFDNAVQEGIKIPSGIFLTSDGRIEFDEYLHRVITHPFKTNWFMIKHDARDLWLNNPFRRHSLNFEMLFYSLYAEGVLQRIEDKIGCLQYFLKYH